MTAKKSATWLRLEAHINTIRDNLAFSAEGIMSDAHTVLHGAIGSCDNEATVQAMIDDWFAARPHLLKTKVLIPERMAEAAFGERPSLAAQGELVKRYGEDAAKECARRWKTAIGSVRPGRHPDSTDSAPVKAVQRDSDREAPNKNPWHPRWNGKDRLAAQKSIIVSLGTKVAASLAKSAGVMLTGQPLRK
jgi:hypothetical protein